MDQIREQCAGTFHGSNQCALSRVFKNLVGIPLNQDALSHAALAAGFDFGDIVRVILVERMQDLFLQGLGSGVCIQMVGRNLQVGEPQAAEDVLMLILGQDGIRIYALDLKGFRARRIDAVARPFDQIVIGGIQDVSGGKFKSLQVFLGPGFSCTAVLDGQAHFFHILVPRLGVIRIF